MPQVKESQLLDKCDIGRKCVLSNLAPCCEEAWVLLLHVLSNLALCCEEALLHVLSNLAPCCEEAWVLLLLKVDTQRYSNVLFKNTFDYIIIL